ncbi:MAG: hypothetical protein GX664_04095 [Bacteroidales bacterium]|nr:hypothetical protein [Bacteroidales bacterium]
MTYKLYTNDKFTKSFKPKCTIKMDNTVDTFNEFVVVGYNEQTGKTTLLQHADPLTLGQAYLLVSKAFANSIQTLQPEQLEELREFLGGML